jgi:hypothetical protein
MHSNGLLLCGHSSLDFSLFTPCLKRQEARFFVQDNSLNRIPENLSLDTTLPGLAGW